MSGVDIHVDPVVLRDEFRRQAQAAREIADFLRSDNPIAKDINAAMEQLCAEPDLCSRLAEKADAEARALEDYLGND